MSWVVSATDDATKADPPVLYVIVDGQRHAENRQIISWRNATVFNNVVSRNQKKTRQISQLLDSAAREHSIQYDISILDWHSCKLYNGNYDTIETNFVYKPNKKVITLPILHLHLQVAITSVSAVDPEVISPTLHERSIGRCTVIGRRSPFDGALQVGLAHGAVVDEDGWAGARLLCQKPRRRLETGSDVVKRQETVCMCVFMCGVSWPMSIWCLFLAEMHEHGTGMKRFCTGEKKPAVSSLCLWQLATLAPNTLRSFLIIHPHTFILYIKMMQPIAMF